MIKKEWLLMSGIIVTTLLISVAVLRWLAPGLLGGPADLQLVQLDEKLPAFYRGVFREEVFSDGEFLLKDPLTRVRARPLFPAFRNLGPNDILGFRNTAVPVTADIVTLGDSMTYGNNAVLDHNWPGYLQARLGRDDINVYNMATGGWAAIQYLDMFSNALAFKPRVVVMAFYTGNDPIESFVMAYGNEHWQWLIPDDTLDKSDAPQVTLDMPDDEKWPVRFSDGVETVFTPRLRLTSNSDSPVVDAGYAIMARVAEQAGKQAAMTGIKMVFTVIPTKELVYRDKLASEGMEVPPDYALLVEREQQNIEAFSDRLSAIPGAVYVDVVSPLQQAARDAVALYPGGINGHPVAAGYEIIGNHIADNVKGLLPAPPTGLYALMNDNTYQVVLINDEGVWYFDSFEDVEANGWPPGELPVIDIRDLARLPHNGIIQGVDKARYGPQSLNEVRSD